MRRALLLSLPLLACEPSIPNVQHPPVVTVVYDPAVADLPTPNDLALQNGVVAIAPSTAFSATENALHVSLNGRDGFSTASTGQVRFSGPISGASVTAGSALAYDLGDHGQGLATEVGVSRTYDDCTHVLSLASSTGFTPGHTYLFALRGGDAGLKDASGGPVYESPAFHLLRAGKDLTQHLDPIPGATRAEKLANATKLEAVRQGLEPYFQTLETKGVPRAEVIALWAFTVQSNGESELDPNAQVVPFPDDLLKDPKTGLVSIPVLPSDNADEQLLKAGFNQLDGFSTTAALYVDFTQALDASTVSASTVRLFARESKQQVSDVDVTLSSDGKRITLQPKSPLLPGTAYVVVAQGLKDGAGHPVTPMPLDGVLTVGQPLVDASGKSQLTFLCADVAKQLEPMRAGIGGVLVAAQIPREGVSAAWTFTTQDIRARAEELWNTPYVQNLPLTVLNPVSAAGPLVMPNVGQQIAGQIYTWDRLDPTTRVFKPNGAGQPRAIDFILSIPKGATGKVKVVVFGHGLNTERRLGMLLADRLARAGFAMMAIDLPLHGERTLCQTDSNCALGNHCAPDGSCLNGSQPGDLARGPGYPGVPGPGTPTATGTGFIDIANLFASRDHFRQALIDFSAQMRMVREFDWSSVTGGVGLDGDHIDYAGISLGGILGGSESGVEPRFEAMLLNVGGAGLVDAMRESATFGPMLTSGLAAKGITAGTPQYHAFVNAARWVLDEIDPINLATYAKTRPWQYVDPKTGQQVSAAPKALRLQEAIGDSVVPNTATARLVTATGIDPSTQFAQFIGTHGFLADPAEASCYAGQEDMAGFLEAH